MANTPYIYGASGHGKVVFHTFACCDLTATAFIDDRANRRLCGLPVLSPPEVQNLHLYTIHFAIGNHEIR